MRVRITDAADLDLLEIWVYIAQDSVQAASRTIRRIKEQFRRLGRFPGIGQARDELAPGLPSIPVGSYVVFYRVSGSELAIERVIHGSRNLHQFFQ